jgi:hypothetical protein
MCLGWKFNWLVNFLKHYDYLQNFRNLFGALNQKLKRNQKRRKRKQNQNVSRSKWIRHNPTGQPTWYPLLFFFSILSFIFLDQILGPLGPTHPIELAQPSDSLVFLLRNVTGRALHIHGSQVFLSSSGLFNTSKRMDINMKLIGSSMEFPFRLLISQLTGLIS